MSIDEISGFDAFGLSAPLLRDIARAGFTEPTPIQTKALPLGLQGRDVLGCAQTGTGKTAAFIIPMIERLADKPKGPPRGLILAPTRELAFQIQGVVDQLGHSRKVFATTIVGGDDMKAQVRGLGQHPNLIVATPGRLLDHMWRGTIDLARFEIVVLDEADRMLDMGFAPQLNEILNALPEERQTLLFSATLPSNLGEFARLSLTDPVRATVARPATTVAGVTQILRHTTQANKTSLLLSVLKKEEVSALVFTRTKHRADRLGEALERSGYSVAVLHGSFSLPKRRKALEGFRRGRYRVLVATDIAARGIDIANIGHVINYDLPQCPEDYVHRIGRTARMKAVGCATSFVTNDDKNQIRAIEKLLGESVPCASGDSPSPVKTTRHTPPAAPQGQRPNRPKRFRNRRRNGSGQAPSGSAV